MKCFLHNYIPGKLCLAIASPISNKAVTFTSLIKKQSESSWLVRASDDVNSQVWRNISTWNRRRSIRTLFDTPRLRRGFNGTAVWMPNSDDKPTPVETNIRLHGLQMSSMSSVNFCSSVDGSALKAIRLCPVGSCRGWDGIRSQSPADSITNKENWPDLPNSLTVVVNLVLDDVCAEPVARHFVGTMRTHGVANGIRWRPPDSQRFHCQFADLRLNAPLLLALDKITNYFGPRMLDVAASCGYELSCLQPCRRSTESMRNVTSNFLIPSAAYKEVQLISCVCNSTNELCNFFIKKGYRNNVAIYQIRCKIRIIIKYD